MGLTVLKIDNSGGHVKSASVKTEPSSDGVAYPRGRKNNCNREWVGRCRKHSESCAEAVPRQKPVYSGMSCDRFGREAQSISKIVKGRWVELAAVRRQLRRRGSRPKKRVRALVCPAARPGNVEIGTAERDDSAVGAALVNERKGPHPTCQRITLICKLIPPFDSPMCVRRIEV